MAVEQIIEYLVGSTDPEVVAMADEVASLDEENKRMRELLCDVDISHDKEWLWCLRSEQEWIAEREALLKEGE